MLNTRESTSSDEVARLLARWLAPYVAAELSQSESGAVRPDDTDLDQYYSKRLCEEYVSALGDRVLESAEIFFDAIVREGEVGSLELTAALGLETPRNVPSVLTTPLKRRAKALGLPYPWIEGVSAEGRTIWADPTSTCKWMLSATKTEIQKRHTRRSR